MQEGHIELRRVLHRGTAVEPAQDWYNATRNHRPNRRAGTDNDMRRASRHQALPLAPLLRVYTEPGLAPILNLGPRAVAVLEARGRLVSEHFLNSASEKDFTDIIIAFYEACVDPPLHTDTVRRRARFLRHGVEHLVRSPDPAPRKLARCLASDGPYRVAGLGPAFWSAVLQALDPVRHPAWRTRIDRGLHRLGLARWQTHDGPEASYAARLQAYHEMRELHPGLTALHLDHFLTLVADLHGRTLPTEATPLDLAAILRAARVRLPLRRRLKERGAALADARRRLEMALTNRDGAEIGAALAIADPIGAARAPIDWLTQADSLTHWIGKLWYADDPDEALEAMWDADPIRGGGLWLPSAVLHLKDARRYPVWDETSRRGHAILDDSVDPGDSSAVRYALFLEATTALRERHRLHALELPTVFALLDEQQRPMEEPRTEFGGFCPETFRFLNDLQSNNSRRWMEAQRDRYQFAVRQPLVELCRAIAERYIEPVLCRQHGWAMETAARSGKALTSVCKNDYGRTVPYNVVQWLTFYRKDHGGKRDDAQFFVRVGPEGVCCGLRLGREARAANRRFRRNVQTHAELLHRALAEGGALEHCLFGDAEEGGGVRVNGPGDLRGWAIGKMLVAAKTIPCDDPMLLGDELVGEVLLTFDRLLPAYACAIEEEPQGFLERRLGGLSAGEPFTDADFCRVTHLGSQWLDRARSLLDLKRQLILQGVPGTGKTHVAQALARLLTHGCGEAVRLVQFHPSYSYEEFVEGIKVKSVERDGRHDVTYPVEQGVLCGFAAEAENAPSQPFVLIIDEINRGNLPRVFGELLYLLEYRDQAVSLPYSRRSFRLPTNLYLIGTMNAADRSVALVDQALRRRFSFLEMPPDAAVLARWLMENPPVEPEFGAEVVRLFERLNSRLASDLGPHCQIGHSYFMVPGLDADRLRVIWQHHVLPVLTEHLAAHPERLERYALELLLDDSERNHYKRSRKARGSV